MSSARARACVLGTTRSTPPAAGVDAGRDVLRDRSAAALRPPGTRPRRCPPRSPCARAAAAPCDVADRGDAGATFVRSRSSTVTKPGVERDAGRLEARGRRERGGGRSRAAPGRRRAARRPSRRSTVTRTPPFASSSSSKRVPVSDVDLACGGTRAAAPARARDRRRAASAPPSRPPSPSRRTSRRRTRTRGRPRRAPITTGARDALATQRLARGEHALAVDGQRRAASTRRSRSRAARARPRRVRSLAPVTATVLGPSSGRGRAPARCGSS